MKKDIVINKEFKKELRCFAELLEVTPEKYQNAILTKDNFPAVLINALKLFLNIDTVYEPLYLSPYELYKTRRIGKTIFERTVRSLITYCENYKGKPVKSQPIDFQTGKLFCVMRYLLNKNKPPSFILNEQELRYLHDFRLAVEVLPYDLLEHEFSKATELLPLRTIIFKFYKMEDRL